MKKHLLFSLMMTFSVGAFAQPTLTGASNNPVVGDNFAVYNCDIAGVTQGASGPAVTWDFHTLAASGTGSVTIVTCASTPYCDSFPPTDLALSYINPGVDTEFDYYTTNSSVFEIIGVYNSGPTFTHFLQPSIMLKYPVVYNSTYLDTSMSHDYAGLPVDYVFNRSSRTVDAYGTLILPSGTYSNVLRVHQTTTMLDSFPGLPIMYTMYSENYSWYSADFHMFLLEMDLDSSGGPSLSVSNVTYLANNSTTAIAAVNNDKIALGVSPNPSSDFINIALTINDLQHAAITLSDISGKVVSRINTSALNVGENKIKYPVSDLPSGLYLLRFTDDTHSVTKKVVVSH